MISEEGFPFNVVWNWHDSGLISFNGAHRVIGTYFNVPECCVEYFLTIHDDEDNTETHCEEKDYIMCLRCWKETNDEAFEA